MVSEQLEGLQMRIKVRKSSGSGCRSREGNERISIFFEVLGADDTSEPINGYIRATGSGKIRGHDGDLFYRRGFRQARGLGKQTGCRKEKWIVRDGLSTFCRSGSDLWSDRVCLGKIVRTTKRIGNRKNHVYFRE